MKEIKINKLFHWLYAFLMFMPIFAIGVTCLYVTFNKNAKDSYSGLLTETISDFTNLNWSNVGFTSNTEIYTFVGGQTTYKNMSYPTRMIEFEISNYLSKEDFDTTLIKYGVFYQPVANETEIYFFEEFTQVPTTGSGVWQPRNYKFKKTQNDTFTLEIKAYSQVWYGLNAGTTYNVNNVEYNRYTYDTNLSNVFYSSIDKVCKSSLFSWAYDSFLGIPITFISGLFGLSSTHIVNLLLSYWLAISIIWLCFDLVMFVPNLVHSWIDKGVIN